MYNTVRYIERAGDFEVCNNATVRVSMRHVPCNMDFNVCSRRVHDGFATIRTRGRPRLRNADLEKLVDEEGPYVIPAQVIAASDDQQVSSCCWLDSENEQRFIENYATLRRAPLGRNKSITLNTFQGKNSSSSLSSSRRREAQENGLNKRLATTNGRRENKRDFARWEKIEEERQTSGGKCEENGKTRQPVYATPAIMGNGNKSCGGELQQEEEENYLPRGDLCSSAKEFCRKSEDNRIDTATYGVINKAGYGGYRYNSRNREMAPMLPIAFSECDEFDEQIASNKCPLMRSSSVKVCNNNNNNNNYWGKSNYRDEELTTKGCQLVTRRSSMCETRRGHHGTMPHRKTRGHAHVKPLHKSTENIVEEQAQRAPASSDYGSSKISLSSADVSLYREDRNEYMIDATEIIHRGSIIRKSSFSLDRYGSLGGGGKSRLARTRHNSLELEDEILDHSSCNGFATLPRRGNHSSKDPSPRRLSANVPVLEPLYEHAVSDPFKPRNTTGNVIPWWELATRKYRYQSCPSLQVNDDNVIVYFFITNF